MLRARSPPPRPGRGPPAAPRRAHVRTAARGHEQQATRLLDDRRDRLPGRAGAQQRSGQAIGVLVAGGRQSPGLRLRRTEAPAARKHESRPGQTEQHEATPETTRQCSPAACASVAVHALDEGHGATRSGDVQREGRIVARGQAAVDERRRVRQRHDPPGTRTLDCGERGGRVADDRHGRARLGEVTGNAGRERAHAGRLRERSEHMRDAKRRLPPGRRVGHDRANQAPGSWSAATSLPPRRTKRRSAAASSGVTTSGHSSTTVNLGSRSRSRGRSRRRTT